MIDEKKLIEDIRELKNHYDFFYKEGRSETDDVVKHASDILFNDIAKIIYKQPKVDDWIPCGERLPEASGIYIVDDRRGGNKWVHLAGFALESQSWCENQGVCFDDVFGRYDNGRIVAWMPLPEP